MSRTEILFSGFGGQGVVLAGRMLGYAAVLAELTATMLVSHGTETRGGYVRSQVIIADEQIDSPVVERADVFGAFSQAAYVRFLPLVSEGVVLYDPVLVTVERTGNRPEQLAVPALTLALEKLGSELFMNIIMLGAALQRIERIAPEFALQSVRELSPRNPEKNVQALELGYNLKLC
ncbi:MAG: 2-oxoacid:acceptor oxidoreductase family protein [Deltaproteobacteria bacterium]|nr:2-oxoacid:acceptor oxidoreductase family protein [Deltaproteobacteria bacterium]